ATALGGASRHVTAKSGQKVWKGEVLPLDRSLLMGGFSDPWFQRAFMDISGQCLMKSLHTQGVMNTRLVLLGSKGVSTGVALHQRVQQCLRLLQVGGVKPLGEPMVHWCKEIMGFLVLSLLLPQASQARGRTEFPGFR